MHPGILHCTVIAEENWTISPNEITLPPLLVLPLISPPPRPAALPSSPSPPPLAGTPPFPLPLFLASLPGTGTPSVQRSSIPVSPPYRRNLSKNRLSLRSSAPRPKGFLIVRRARTAWFAGLHNCPPLLPTRNDPGGQPQLTNVGFGKCGVLISPTLPLLRST